MNRFWLLILPWVLVLPAHADHAGDPHYTEMGFFDMHVCNWPGQPPFYLTLFSTTRFDELDSVEVFTPGGASLGSLSKTRFRLMERKQKPDKRVYITHLPIPEQPVDGWHTARVLLRNGTILTARDYVIHELMPRADGLEPSDGGEEIPMPYVLRWKPVPGAKYYQVFIRDLWEGEKVIHTSKLLATPKLLLPTGLLRPGGYYAWRVHARDVNEHALLGDFNNGSLSDWSRFTVSEE